MWGPDLDSSGYKHDNPKHMHTLIQLITENPNPFLPKTICAYLHVIHVQTHLILTENIKRKGKNNKQEKLIISLYSLIKVGALKKINLINRFH